MYCLSLLFAAFIAVLTLPHSPVFAKPFSLHDPFSLGGRVIGGEDATPGQFPYQLQLRVLGQFACGATLAEINGKQVAVTAAHCVTWPGTTIPFIPIMVCLTAGITAKDEEGQKQIVKRIKVHEDYSFTDEGVPLNDIAVLQFFEDFKLDDKLVKSLALPTKDQATTGEVLLSGWGRTSKESQDAATTLQFVSLPLVDSKECNKMHAGGDTPQVITDGMLCAGYETAEKSGCHGDSGGPAAGKEGDASYLAGVVSWGDSECSKFPTVFTRVSSYVDWINSNVE